MTKEQEASSSGSSNSSSNRIWKYDIFLSFRGEDTRSNFADHLYHALHRRGFVVFRDEEAIERGEVISNRLLQAIEDSRFSIVIVSANYANSSWCLTELQHILASRKELGLQVFPIFYKVNPSDVRHQRGSFAEAFVRHEEKQTDQQKVEKWRDALTEIGNVSGWDSGHYEYETELIEDVVENLWNQFRSRLPPGHNDTLVGIDWRVDEVSSQLGIGLDDVLFIGIWGLGGVGKTTLARAIYERFHSQFGFHCFLANVREVSERDGEVYLQRKLLSSLKLRNIDIEDAYDGKMIIQNYFRNKKVLLILDDVNSISQLQNLAGSRQWFGGGSRVIITTRNVRLLRSHRVDEIYEVKPMNHDESLQLFRKKAFLKDQPGDKDVLELFELVMDYTGGLPLALCVLGSHFCGSPVSEWSSVLDLLKEDPHNGVFKILKISCDSLTPTERKIFLDIACFFNMWGKDEVRQILESCGLNAAGMKTLIEKSLLAEIEIGNNKYLEMHNLVQEMGRIIVCEESHFNVSRQSRLWLPTDIDQVLKRNVGTDAMGGVALPFSFAKDKAYWHADAFSKMSSLQLLIMSCNFDLPLGLRGFPSTLKVLQWYGFPLEAFPFEEELDQLVHLKMQNSKLRRLSNDIQLLENLEFLDLSHSKYLVETPNFYGFPKLERLVLEGCVELAEIHPSLGNHNYLVEVSLKGCMKLKVLPTELEMTSLKVLVLEETGIEEVPESLGSLTNVEALNLRSCRNLKVVPKKLDMNSLKEFILCGCTQVRNLPEFGENMKNLVILDAKETGIVELPESLGLLTSLKTLNLRGCKNLVGLPHNIHNLKRLKVLNISGCSTFFELPEDLNENEALKILDASETAITKVPSSIGHLEGLEMLSFHGCSFPDGLPDSIFNIESLKELDLSYCNIDDGIIPDDLSGLSSLQKLDLSGNIFADLPAGCISSLSNLQYLYLNSCPRVCFLPQPSPRLDIMDAGDCTSLRTLSDKEFSHLFASINQSRQFAERISHRLNADSQASLPIKTFSATIPGSEIPLWFENQKYLSLDREYESSITIDIPPCEWLRFVLCIVLEDDMFYSTEEANQNEFGWRCYSAKASNGNFVFLQGRGRKDEKEINSPHLWIVFGQIGQENGSCLSMDYSHLLLKFEAQKNEKLNPIKCGWRVISKIEFESLLSTMEECEKPVFEENTRGCEAEEGQLEECNSSVSESRKTISKEYDTKAPAPSSPCLEEEGKLDDSWTQFITDKASDCGSAPLVATAASTMPSIIVRSPISSSFHEHQSSCQAAYSPCLEEADKLEDSKMPFITHNACHRDFSAPIVNPAITKSASSSNYSLSETHFSSNCCPFESTATQEASICSDYSINDAQVAASKQSPSRERNHVVGVTLVPNTVSKAGMPDSEQTSAEKIFEELSKVSDLEATELLQIYDILIHDERMRDAFKALHSQFRKGWILMQIKKYSSYNKFQNPPVATIIFLIGTAVAFWFGYLLRSP